VVYFHYYQTNGVESLKLISIKFAYCLQFIGIILNVLDETFSKEYVMKHNFKAGKCYVLELYTQEILTIFSWEFWLKSLHGKT
jgi:hypothetical protein